MTVPQALEGVSADWQHGATVYLTDHWTGEESVQRVHDTYELV